jgi:hypothetical protein
MVLSFHARSDSLSFGRDSNRSSSLVCHGRAPDSEIAPAPLDCWSSADPALRKFVKTTDARRTNTTSNSEMMCRGEYRDATQQ